MSIKKACCRLDKVMPLFRPRSKTAFVASKSLGQRRKRLRIRRAVHVPRKSQPPMMPPNSVNRKTTPFAWLKGSQMKPFFKGQFGNSRNAHLGLMLYCHALKQKPGRAILSSRKDGAALCTPEAKTVCSMPRNHWVTLQETTGGSK